MTAQKPTSARPPVVPQSELDLFTESFLNRWEGNSQVAYRMGIKVFFEWCETRGLHPIYDIKRPHLELYMTYLRDERGNSASTIRHRLCTVRQFHDIAVDDELINRNPGLRVRLPKVRIDLNKKVSLDRNEMGLFMHHAAKASPTDYALMVLMGYLGLRVTEACNLDIPDCLEVSKAHRVVKIVSKGGEIAVLPQPPVVMRALDAVIGDRTEGPVFVRRDGSRMTRSSAAKIVRRIAKAAGIQMKMSCHTLRHSSIAGAIDAGVPLRTVQLSARHRDISTTVRIYDRGRQNLDTHSSHVLATYFGAAS